MKRASVGEVGKAEYDNWEKIFGVLMDELEYQLSRQDRPEDKADPTVVEAFQVHGNLQDIAYDTAGDIVLRGDALVNTCGQLKDLLGRFSPDYCRFGWLPAGDHRSYGHWPQMEDIDELPKFNDKPNGPQEGDYAVVNDHGNVTVYGADGTVLLELV